MSEIGSKSSDESTAVDKKSMGAVVKEVWAGVKEWFPFLVLGGCILFLVICFLLSWV